MQTGVSFGISWINKVLIDDILIDNQFQLIFFVIVTYLTFSIMSVGLYMLVPRIKVFLNETIIFMLRNRLTKSVLFSKFEVSCSSNKGDIVNIYSGDIPNISSLISRTLIDLIEQSVTLVIIVGVFLVIDYRIALLLSCKESISSCFILLINIQLKNKYSSKIVLK